MKAFCIYRFVTSEQVVVDQLKFKGIDEFKRYLPFSTNPNDETEVSDIKSGAEERKATIGWSVQT